MGIGSDPLVPLRVKPAEAAKLLSLSTAYVRNKLLRRGEFTVLRPYGFGAGKPCYLLYHEVHAYAIGGLQALRDLRRKAARKANRVSRAE